jgi:hypothetical protein
MMKMSGFSSSRYLLATSVMLTLSVSSYVSFRVFHRCFSLQPTRLTMELSDVIAGLEYSLIEGDDWNRTLRAQSRKRNMKKVVVQPGQRVKIHLGAGLRFGE